MKTELEGFPNKTDLKKIIQERVKRIELANNKDRSENLMKVTHSKC
jgi:hypothetical protein